MPRRFLPLILTGAALIAPSTASAAGGSVRAARATAAATLHKAQAIRHGRGVKTGFELTPLLKELSVRMKYLTGTQRREAVAMLQRPTIGPSQIFGYSAPDPGQRTNSQSAYLVMDNDYRQSEYPRYSSPLPPMEVTAAHEYNHVLQFGYDVLQDTWLFESTAVWMEDKVYDDVNDYLSYLTPWAQLSQVPITRFD